MRQLLVREAFLSPISSQVERQHLSDVHAREGSVLWSILPRSILDKLRMDFLVSTCRKSRNGPLDVNRLV
jgi:hypothetical protein